MSGAPEVRIAEDAQELGQEAADLFVWLGQQAVAASGRFRVVLSGGTTPKLLYAMLVSPAFSGQLEWPRVEFYFGDERCVPPDHPESNFRMADETLLRPLKIAPERIFRMRGEADDPDEAAREYETVLRTQFGVPAPGWPSFDLILLGLGEDGHTASLFPGAPALEERARLVVASRAPGGVKNRLTLTVPAMNQARVVLFLVSGIIKAAAVHAVIEDRETGRVPAKLIRPVSGRVIWILDRAAASGLTVAKQGVVSHEE
ncbi:MAG: 6-phosphogluconolactonase [Nitrospirae bacterium 13_1_40CM_2_62_10]|nr:MAG: 6-phosphogluconolactonase [Nitrospirae bacterium 13_1_40CM_2_62_10]